MLYNKLCGLAMNNNVIPQTYDSSLSMQEKIDYIFSLLQDIPKLEDKLKAIDEMIENLNKTIAEDVAKELQALKDSGELEAMLKEIYDEEEKAINKVSFLPTKREWRNIYNARFTPQVNDNKFHKYFLQGCHVYQLGDELVLSGNFVGTINSTGTEQLGINAIQCVTFKNKGRNNIHSPSTYAWGHANGLTYNPQDGKLYAVAGSNSGDMNIYRVDPEFTTEPEGKELLDGASADIAYYNGYLYVRHYNPSAGIGKGWDIERIDWEAGTKEVQCTIVIPENAETGEFPDVFNFDIQDNKIFCVSSETREIFVYNLDNGELLWTYKYGIKDYTGQYIIKEVEGISVRPNGDIYLITCGYQGMSDVAQNMEVAVFKCNYKNNIVTSDWNHGVNPMNNTTSNIVYCNPNATGIYNPTGTEENPFTDLNEAISYVNNNPMISMANIRLQSGYRYQLCTTCTKAIEINGWKNGAYPTQRADYQTIGGAFVVGCPRIQFSYISFRNTTSNMTNSTKGTSGKAKGVVTAYNSNMTVINSVVVAGGNEPLGYYEAPTVSSSDSRSISTYLGGGVIYTENDSPDTFMGYPSTANRTDTGSPSTTNLFIVGGVGNIAMKTANNVMVFDAQGNVTKQANVSPDLG